jgi:hypothetical protein
VNLPVSPVVGGQQDGRARGDSGIRQRFQELAHRPVGLLDRFQVLRGHPPVAVAGGIHPRKVHKQERRPVLPDPPHRCFGHLPVAPRHFQGVYGARRKERPELFLPQHRHGAQTLLVGQRKCGGKGDVGLALGPAVPVHARDLGR